MTLRRRNDLMSGVLIHQDERICNYTMKLTDLQVRCMKTNIIIYGLEKGPSYPLQLAQSNQPLIHDQCNDDNNDESYAEHKRQMKQLIKENREQPIYHHMN